MNAKNNSDAQRLLQYYKEQEEFVNNIKTKAGFYIDEEIACSNLVFFHDDKPHQTFQKVLGHKIVSVLHDHLQEIKREIKNLGVEL